MNLFTHSFSNLRRNGLYSCIHLVGLSVSLTAVFFIFLWVRDELSTDRYHQQIENTYIIVEQESYYGADSYSEYVPTGLVQAAIEEIPEIKEACLTREVGWSVLYLEHEGNKFFENQILRADTSLFLVFDYTFLEGDPRRAFIDNSSVVITKQLANKIFGNSSAYGAPITIMDNDGKSRIVYVSAVVIAPPKLSTLSFDAVLPLVPTSSSNAWHAWAYRGFVTLHRGADIDQIGVKLMELCKRFIPYEEIPWKPFILFPLSKYHLYHLDGSGGKIVVIRLFMLIGSILLLMACVNYVNLVTARAVKRHREMAIKKSVGATRGSLFKQLISEAIFLFLISLFISVFILYTCYPFYIALTGSSLSLHFFDPYLWSLYLSSLLIVTLLAGLYPVLYLSSFKPLVLYRNPKPQTGRLSLRRALVIFQFCCSFAFTVAMLVMGMQFRYMQQEQLGDRTKDLFSIDFYDNPYISNHMDVILSDLSHEAAIAGTSLSYPHIMEIGDYTDSFKWEGMEEGSWSLAAYLKVNSDFPHLMGLEFIQGEGFTGTPADSSRILLNQTAVKRMGIDHPVGKWFEFWGTKYQITGVVKDFHFQHMKEAIEPLVIFIDDPYSHLYVKALPGQHQRAMAAVEKVCRVYDAESPFNFRFMSDTFADIYLEDKQMTRLFNLFSALAVLISCLGLFGLVTFTAETRTKEIGIRKVMGARVGQMVYMLCKEFILLTGIAMVIAFPIAYYWLNRMLQEYAYRINMSWLMFALAALITVGITLFTVSWQAIRAATANPVDSVKMV